ncbi:MAG: protein kinase [Cyanobacteria bacterium SZAS LIN-2]|nr:protein kinase [Cyanobacteria bacterium SZAS LIN-3]MBS1995415.1 protein kinase [Cyanobacteria bacterium SZAS LIN-2]MBS2010311.1 protein kinase [Cyanobacteria bacterium SZAS TMP-1]
MSPPGPGAASTSEKQVPCPTCGASFPRSAKFCGFDGTDLSLATANGLTRKSCPVCGRFYPGYASFCAFDRSSLAEVKSSSDITVKTPVNSPTATQLSPASQQYSQSQPVQNETTDISTAPVSAWAAPPGVPSGPTASSSPTKGTITPELAEQSQDMLTMDENGQPYSTLIGKTIDSKYLVQSVLGEGGMAIVYRAHHLQMERVVVIKVMQGWLTSNKTSVERFEREGKLTAKLNHPNIVAVYDVGSIDGREPYIVMEYIKGEALADRIHNGGPLDYDTTANIIIQICHGLEEAHSSGIIHRDLKPDNVLLQTKSDRPDWVKIVDFGISNMVQGAKRLTKTGRMVGTPEYIAPEQLKDKPIDIRTDLYAVGIMIFEMLTGRVPFDGESAESILMKHLLEEPPPMSTIRPELAGENPFEPVVNKLLKKAPEERYQSAEELRHVVEQLRESLPKK